MDENGERAQYWIPDYQRGYRWDQQQVTQLLDDIWEFIQSDNGAFYCLQPLVVRKLSDGRYEVVDGQQRLTTIYILLTLELPKKIVELLGKLPFSIDYQTRDSRFLDDIDVNRAAENVDFYHICEAQTAIEEWIKNRSDGNHVLKLLEHLLNEDDTGRNVRFIWYELAASDNPAEVFTRLNVGKIPLTETELVRALFLRQAALDENNNGDRLSLRIAYEWDQIEKRLQDDSFWCFLQNPNIGEFSRIGLIFKLAAMKDGAPLNGEGYEVFLHFARLLKQSSNAECNWREIKKVFMALEEWYEDRSLFHVLGFIFYRDKGNLDSINRLLNKSLILDKPSFSQYLREKIWRMMHGNNLSEVSLKGIEGEISELCLNTKYKDAEMVRSLLLLFNLATLLRDSRSNIRFQFDSFKQLSWDIEHIRPVSDSRPTQPKDQKDWLTQCLKFLQTVDGQESLIDQIKIYLNQDAIQTSFEEIDQNILSIFSSNEDGQFHDDDLANLTLLDSRTNRSYKNAVFAVKRHILLELDRSGVFVPLCTRNVFLKCYSRAVGGAIFWTGNDAEDYFDQICNTLTWFFGGEETEEQ